MATTKDIALVRELRPSSPAEEQTIAKDTALVQEFRLTSLAEEFEQHSQAEIERLGSDHPDFDGNLYQEAVSLVLRKLSQHRKE